MLVLNEIICIFQLKLVRIIVKSNKERISSLRETQHSFPFSGILHSLSRTTISISFFHHFKTLDTKSSPQHVHLPHFPSTVFPPSSFHVPFLILKDPLLLVSPLPPHPSLMLPKECHSQQQCVKHCLVFSRKKIEADCDVVKDSERTCGR